MSTRRPKNRPRADSLPEGLHALCDDAFRPGLPVREKARALIEGQPAVIQVRLKRTPGSQAVPLLREVIALARSRGVLCVINDRPDWALLTGADGVHLGAEDLPVAQARRLLGPGALIGATVRSEAMARAAFEEGASYVGLGPIFATRTKQVDHPALGLEGLAQVCRSSPLPVVAIAGIGRSNIRAVAQAGAHGAAVLSELLGAPDPAAAARLLGREFQAGRAPAGEQARP